MDRTTRTDGAFMFLSLGELLAASVLVFLGAMVQSAVGFGLAIVAAPLLYLIDPRLVPGPILLLALVLSALNVWRNRAGLAVRELGSAVVGRVPGVLLALWLLQVMPTRMLSLVLAAAVLLAVAISIAPVRLTPTPRRLLVAGFASGFMGTSTSIGGPPMALLYQHAVGPRIRANLNGYFVIGSLMSLIGLAAIGRFGFPELYTSLALLPAAVAGFLLSRFTLPWWDRGAIRPVLLILCAIAAAGVLADSF
jgi:uncharacterized membrane protein YfcA